ncbi:MAG: hypothetical protein U9N52_07385 [Campylobacterota bacterium]|nr:hypothetical protein [Campylobacterota bacterium]
MNITNLAAYTNTNYNPGSTLKRTLWYFTNMLCFKTMLPLPFSMKVTTLKILATGTAIPLVIASEARQSSVAPQEYFLVPDCAVDCASLLAMTDILRQECKI